jgi:NarL family two-component system sensor histidine kinase LiaS
MARWLVRRLQRVTMITEGWSKGNFSLMARDNSQDELGEMARKLNHMAGKLERLMEEQQQVAVLEERNRLARDLHDSLKQQIFAIMMQIWSTQAFLGQNLNLEAARERLGVIENLLVQTQKELSSLIFQLRPVELADKPFAMALREYCERWSKQHGIQVRLRIAEITLSLKAEEALFRLVQEALTNVARHSLATAVQLDLRYDLDQLTLSVSDNGQGFNPHASNLRGIGLNSMRERMEALGGSISVESTAGVGTRIVAYYNMGNAGVMV